MASLFENVYQVPNIKYPTLQEAGANLKASIAFRQTETYLIKITNFAKGLPGARHPDHL